jgi:hypothetical protein
MAWRRILLVQTRSYATNSSEKYCRWQPRNIAALTDNTDGNLRQNSLGAAERSHAVEARLQHPLTADVAGALKDLRIRATHRALSRLS